MGSDATISGDSSVAWDKDKDRARERVKRRSIQGGNRGALIGMQGHPQLNNMGRFVGWARSLVINRNSLLEDKILFLFT